MCYTYTPSSIHESPSFIPPYTGLVCVFMWRRQPNTPTISSGCLFCLLAVCHLLQPAIIDLTDRRERECVDEMIEKRPRVFRQLIFT